MDLDWSSDRLFQMVGANRKTVFAAGQSDCDHCIPRELDVLGYFAGGGVNLR